ncbi:hypothetical protein AKJ16_DCAP05050 [Drosera capensis]
MLQVSWDGGSIKLVPLLVHRPVDKYLDHKLGYLYYMTTFVTGAIEGKTFNIYLQMINFAELVAMVFCLHICQVIWAIIEMKSPPPFGIRTVPAFSKTLPLGTNSLLHFRYFRNIMPPFSISSSRALRNLFSVKSSVSWYQGKLIGVGKIIYHKQTLIKSSSKHGGIIPQQ